MIGMRLFFTVFLAALVPLLLAGAAVWVAARKVLRSMTDRSGRAGGGGASLAGKAALPKDLTATRVYQEIDQRAQSGPTVECITGNAGTGSPWDSLSFNPIYLSRLPTSLDVPIGTDVVIGSRAKRPLELEIPVLIGGMACRLALSKQAKIALARGASMAGTCTNTGDGPFLKEEREAADRLIVQYGRGGWAEDEPFLQKADMIEIHLGDGATGSAPISIPPETTQNDPELAQAIGVYPGQPACLPPSFGDVKNATDLKRLVNRLRNTTLGTPIAVKLGATQHLERELDILLEAGVDAIAICGSEGGYCGAAHMLPDSVGIPTMAGVVRAARHMADRGVRDKVTLLAGGGLSTPGQFLKAMALGADAVFIGTAALVALAAGGMANGSPASLNPLFAAKGQNESSFDVEKGAGALANYLSGCVAEMKLIAFTVGRTHLGQVCAEDLCTVNHALAPLIGVKSVWAGR